MQTFVKDYQLYQLWLSQFKEIRIWSKLEVNETWVTWHGVDYVPSNFSQFTCLLLKDNTLKLFDSLNLWVTLNQNNCHVSTDMLKACSCYLDDNNEAIRLVYNPNSGMFNIHEDSLADIHELYKSDIRYTLHESYDDFVSYHFNNLYHDDGIDENAKPYLYKKLYRKATKQIRESIVESQFEYYTTRFQLKGLYIVFYE